MTTWKPGDRVIVGTVRAPGSRHSDRGTVVEVNPSSEPVPGVRVRLDGPRAETCFATHDELEPIPPEEIRETIEYREFESAFGWDKDAPMTEAEQNDIG